MPALIDLHVHTWYSSDADHSVPDVVSLARAAGVTVLAITDHDSIVGTGEACAVTPPDVVLIPAVELTTVHENTELHVLGYFIDLVDSALRDELAVSADLDSLRAREIVAKLNTLGFDVTVDEVERLSPQAAAKGSVIARALFTNGRNATDSRLAAYRDGSRSGQPYHNFFMDFLRPGQVGYVAPQRYFSSERAISTIRRAGGLPVLAHPGSSLSDDKRAGVIHDLVELGLEGIEAYSSYHNALQVGDLIRLARSSDLLVTVGSDFHGATIKPGIAIGANCPDAVRVADLLTDMHERLSRA